MAPVPFQTVIDVSEPDARPPRSPDDTPGRFEQHAQPHMDNARHIIPIKIIECLINLNPLIGY
jgi:hypothetical protein